MYENDPSHFRRTVTSAANSARIACLKGTIDEAVIAIGDCSPTRCLPPDVVEDLASTVGPAPLEHHFFDANLGSGGGSNALWGEREHPADLLLILNPDTICAPRFVDEIVSALCADSSIGVADGRQIPMEHPKSYDPVTLDVSWASGACMLVRGDVFDSLGGFAAEFFPLYCDDVDLSWRVRLAGRRCIHVPDAVVHHDKRPSGAGHPEASTLEHYWSALGVLLMGTRWGRDDLVAQAAKSIAANDDATHGRALRDFEDMRSEGRLPEPICGADSVATFVAGNYSEHRF